MVFTYVVSEAADEDAAAFASFLRRAWEQAGPDSPGFAGATDASIAELTAPATFCSNIGGPDRRMFVARTGTEIVGFSANRRIEAGTVELAGIVVLADHAGRGIGTALVEAAVEQARREGYASMLVKTETSNHRARAFYEKLGFDVDGVEKEPVDSTMVEVWRLSRRL